MLMGEWRIISIVSFTFVALSVSFVTRRFLFITFRVRKNSFCHWILVFTWFYCIFSCGEQLDLRGLQQWFSTAGLWTCAGPRRFFAGPQNNLGFSDLPSNN